MRLYRKCIKVSTVFICVHFTKENTLAFEDGYCMKDCQVSNHGKVDSIGEFICFERIQAGFSMQKEDWDYNVQLAGTGSKSHRFVDT